MKLRSWSLSEESRLAGAVGASSPTRLGPELLRMIGILLGDVSMVHGNKNAKRAKKRAGIKIRRNERCVNASFTALL